MQLNAAENLVAEWAEKHANSLGLTGSNVNATYIYNPGGFVNQSFRLTDGSTYLHVKFAEERKAPCLKQWADNSAYLAKNYHAPYLVQEVTEEVLPGYVYGLVFEYVAGKPLDAVADSIPVVWRVLQKLQKLHHDTQLQGAAGVEKSYTYADAFAEEYITRFEEDLQVIRSGRDLLDFVSDESLDWFAAEVGRLQREARKQPCFQRRAMDVVHNDLNWQNILVNERGDFWIIDWDDMTTNGDAAMDYSVLLWPLYRSKGRGIWEDKIMRMIDAEAMERLALYFRAKLLDDVIDVLADYVEAEDFPDVKETAQRRARETHLRAYEDYRKMYVSSC